MENNLQLNDINIIFRKTKPKELLDIGYELKDIEQILEEPTITTCSLWKNGKQVAYFYFYNIKENIEIEELYNKVIDYAYIDNKEVKLKLFTFKQKLFYNIIIHLISIIILYYSSTISSEEVALDIIALLLPTTVGTILWLNGLTYKKGITTKKLLVFMSGFLNFGISVLYASLIYNYFY